MAGPWEKYASAPADDAGPWTKYSQPDTSPKEAPFGEQLVSAAVRPVVKAITSLPTLALDAGYGLSQFLQEKRLPTLNDFNPFARRTQPLPSDIINNALDKVTVAPNTMGGKLAELGSTVLLGAKVPGSVPMPTPEQSLAQAAARARAGVEVGSGQAGASTSVNVAPEVRMQGGGYTFGNVGEDASAGLNVAKQAVAQQGQNIGMRMTPGQATGSRALQQLEAKLESQPMTSGPFNTLKANNATVLNRATAASIGEQSNVVDSTTLNRAFDRLSGVFEDAGDNVVRQIDPDRFLETVSRLEQQTQGMGMPVAISQHPLVNEVMTLASKGQATGEQLQQLTSKLGKAAYKQMTTPSGDRDLGGALYQFKDYVDSLLQQGMSVERAQRFAAARTQYRNLMTLTSRTGVVNPSSGDVSGRALATTLQRSDKTGFLRGQNTTPMYQAARFAQAFQPIVGDSGTATRMPLQGLTDLAMRVPMNIASRAYLSSPSIRAFSSASAGARASSDVLRNSLMLPQLGPNPYVLPPLMQGLFDNNR